MKKGNILLVVRWPVGGIRTFIKYVYLKNTSDLWYLSILAPELPEMQVLSKELSSIDFCYIPIDINPSPISFAIYIYLELKRNKYDIVHSHGFTSGMCSAIPAWFTKTKHIMTSHDVINEKQFIGIKGKIKKIAMKSMFGLIDTIHSVSHDAGDNLIKHFPNLNTGKKKCIVIPNGIEIGTFKNSLKRDLRSELGLNENAYLIGFFGRFMSQKGFKYLVDSIDILKQDLSLSKYPIVLTFGYGGFIREERQEIKARGLEEHFIHMPFEANIAGAINGLDVVVMPSLWEACGLLSMEVLTCGTPLITSDCIGLREVVRDTPTNIVPTANSAALAQAIRREMESNRKNEFMNFRETAAKRFDVTSTGNALFKYYEKLMGL